MTNKPQARDEQMIERAIREKLDELDADPPYHAAELARAAHSLMAAKVAELEGALKPFAKIYDNADATRAPDDLQYGCVVALGALRRAAALAPHPEGTDQ